MAWLAVTGTALRIVLWILNTWKEANDELKKQKTEALQSAVRGIVDMDDSRVNAAFDKLHRLRQK